MQKLKTPVWARGAADALCPKGGRGRDKLTTRLRAGTRWLLVLPPTGALLLVVAQTGAAGVAESSHLASISIDCEAVSFTVANFPSGTAQIDYAIKLDGATTGSGTFNVTGPSDGKVIANHVEGLHTVSASASWTGDHGGTADHGGTVAGSQMVTCASPSPPPPPDPPAPPLPPPPPPASSPPATASAVEAPPTLLTPIEIDDSPVTPADPPTRRCRAKQRMVNHTCVPAAAVKKPKPVKAAVKTKHMGVFSSKKTKLLPFTK